MHGKMRTTVNIDDDVLLIAKNIANRQKTTVGQVLSELARRALKPSATQTQRNGVPLLPVRQTASPVTLDIVNQLRDGAEHG